MTGPVKGAASNRAVEAASWGEVMEPGRIGPNNARAILDLAHDPALGEDRSVAFSAVLNVLYAHEHDRGGSLYGSEWAALLKEHFEVPADRGTERQDTA